MDAGDKHMQVLMNTFVGPNQPILPDPAPDWDYAKALKSAYTNFPAHCKAMQSRGGHSSDVGAAYDWLKDCKGLNGAGGQRYFAAKGARFLEGSCQGDLIKRLRRENRSLRTDVTASRRLWKLHLMYTPLLIMYLLANWG